MTKLIRILTCNYPSMSESYDAVFYPSNCPGKDACTCAPYDHDEEDAQKFEPAGVVTQWLTDQGFPIAYGDHALLFLGDLSESQRLAFKLRWGI